MGLGILALVIVGVIRTSSSGDLTWKDVPIPARGSGIISVVSERPPEASRNTGCVQMTVGGLLVVLAGVAWLGAGINKTGTGLLEPLFAVAGVIALTVGVMRRITKGTKTTGMVVGALRRRRRLWWHVWDIELERGGFWQGRRKTFPEALLERFPRSHATTRDSIRLDERTTMSDSAFRPRINHVALSLSKSALDDRGRSEILAFYGDVFGWSEGDNTGEDGNPLILYTGAPMEFVYLLPSDEPLIAPALDHFGLQVATRTELTAIVDRAKRHQARDPRVRIIDVHARTTHGPASDYTLTSAYIGFVLPLMIELQHIERIASGG